jgi:hypothetical protein
MSLVCVVFSTHCEGWCAVAVTTALHSSALSLCRFLPLVRRIHHISYSNCLDAAAQIVTSPRAACHGAIPWPNTPVTNLPSIRPHVSLICLHSPVPSVPNFVKSRQTCTQWISPRWRYAKNACVNPHAGDRDILTTGLMTSRCQLVALNTAHRQMTRYCMWRSGW